MSSRTKNLQNLMSYSNALDVPGATLWRHKTLYDIGRVAMQECRTTPEAYDVRTAIANTALLTGLSICDLIFDPRRPIIPVFLEDGEHTAGGESALADSADEALSHFSMAFGMAGMIFEDTHDTDDGFRLWTYRSAIMPFRLHLLEMSKKWNRLDLEGRARVPENMLQINL